MPYRSIEDPAKLRRVLEATLLLEADLDLSTLLRHIVVEAQSMTNARYGALGVLSEDGESLSQFLTVGLTAADEEQIGARPTGQGVLGILITDPQTMRTARLQSHPASFGFPPNHPPMTSFLGVPISVRGETYGNLYLTDKVGWSEFTSDDAALIEALAVTAGIAIENARLHARVQEVAIFEERDRLARDLHDTVIQRLFAIGLSLQSMVSNPSGELQAERLTRAITDVDDTIRQVRTSIFELGSAEMGRSLRTEVLSLLGDLRAVVGFPIRASFEGPVDLAVPDNVRENLLAVIREAVTNIGKHAGATAATVTIEVSSGECRLRVLDDGCGFSDADVEAGGLGLGNLRRRAEKLGGWFRIEHPDTGGSSLIWRVPITS